MISYSGLDEIDALLELIDNAIDWRHSGRVLNIRFVVNNYDELLIIDNAMGMTIKNFKKMFMLYNQDLDGPQGRSGICGYGTKAALKKLCSSEKTKHSIITKHDDDNYYTQTTDWNQVTTMDKAFPIYDSSPEEIGLFKQYNNNQSGTIIKVGLTEDLRQILDQQFENKIEKDLKLNKYFSIVYNVHNDINIDYKYKNNITNPLVFVSLFSQENEQYLNGMDGNKRIIVRIKYNKKTQQELVYIKKNNKYYYIHKRGGNCPSKPIGPKDNLPHISIDEHHEELEFVQHLCCLKPDDSYYNPEKPSLPCETGLTSRDNYRTQFFGTSINNEINGKMLVCRNDSIIGNIPIGKIAVACGKGTAKDKFQKIHVSSQLDYNTTSNQKDVSDFYMHTQKNKHQYEKKDSRKALWRMCDYNREEFSNELWYYIDTESQNYTKKKAIDTISNAYRVYKFKEHIQNKINIKTATHQTLVSNVSRSPSPVQAPVSTVSRSPSPVQAPVSTVSRSPSPVPSNRSSEPLASRSPSPSNRSPVSTVSRPLSLDPVPVSTVSRPLSLDPVPVQVPVSLTHSSPEPIAETHDEIQIKRIRILTEDVSLDQETRYAVNWMLEQYEMKCNEIL